MLAPASNKVIVIITILIPEGEVCLHIPRLSIDPDDYDEGENIIVD